MEVGSPKQKDFRKRTESLDSIEREIETMQHKSEPELEVENSPVSRGIGKENCPKNFRMTFWCLQFSENHCK